MFSYYNTQLINNSDVVDVWKELNLSSEIDTDKYQFHILNEHENLMDLSYMYYGTINDWWCIYLFNELYDANFCILSTSTIENTQNRYVYDIQHYDEITRNRKQYIEYLIRQYYKKDNSLEQAIILTNNRLSLAVNRTDSIFIEDFKIYIYEELINNSTYRIKLKIPTQTIINIIKNKMEKYRILWKN